MAHPVAPLAKMSFYELIEERIRAYRLVRRSLTQAARDDHQKRLAAIEFELLKRRTRA